MAIVTALVEFDPETHQFVGSIPGIPGARSQGLTLEELSDNLREVLLLLRDAVDDVGISVDEFRRLL